MDALDTFFETCAEMLYIAERDGTIRRRSAAFAELFGGELGSLVELAQEDHRASLTDFLGRLEPSGEGGELTFPAAKDGLTLRCRARRAADGSLHGAIHPAPADEALGRIERRLLHAIMEHLEIALWAIDTEGLFVYHDGRALATVGLTRNQFLGLNIFDLYPDGSTAEIRAALAGARSHSTSVQHDILWENWYIPLAGPDDGVDFVAGITLDISDKIKRESELTRQLETIKEQQKAIQELSTPIIEVWDKVLTAPLIGFINSQRADNLMERLLHEVTRTGARFAIIDLTGVDAIDTATASHLLRLLMSIRLLGAEGIITGISSHVAQTMVGLGVELSSITTRANLREGLRFCMGKMRERD
jgi:rsbT co-antagonist protein RsbR